MLLKEDVQKDVNVLQFNSECFPREEHVRSSEEFSAIYAGKRVSGSMFIVYYLRTNILEDTSVSRKAGFTVSKKVSKSAVQRNKLKRRLRNIYRTNKSMLPDNISIIIRALPKAQGASYDGIKGEILNLFKTITSKESSNITNKGI